MLREYISDPRYVTTEEDTIFALLANRAGADPDDLIAQWQDEETRRWRDVTAGQMLERVRAVAKGLMGLGAKPGSMVAIYSATCYEWGVVDFACAAIGAVSVPIYETDSAKQAASIIDDTTPLIAFAGDYDHAQTLEQIRVDREHLKYVFNFKADGLDAVADFGERVDDGELDRAIARVKADDMSTIVYTSGSTGKPKGAMLSHRNFTHIVHNGYEILNNVLYQPNRLLLFLPLAHCFARYIQYVAIGGHGVVGYVPSAKHLLADLRSFKPTYLLGVPRVFEKVYNAASQKAGAGIKGRIFAQAFAHFVQWSKEEQSGAGHSLVARLKHMFYMQTVGTSVRSALGPNLRYLACGGAPLNADLAHFFNGMDDITFIQGYGMTETAAPMLVNWEDDNVVGSVGKPGPGMGVRLGEDDELLLTGPNVFLGYYKQPELTAAAMTEDGWIRSGDLGTIDENGFVAITGRKKDIIITAGGKNVSPAPMEDVINTCPIVSHTVVVGDGKPFIAALVELDDEMTRSWLGSQGLNADMSMAEVAQSDAVRAFIQQYIDQANANVSRAESVRKFVILDEEFTQESGTLTPSMKMVRPKVLARYADLIENELYAPKASSRPVPATARIIDRTTETVQQMSESVKQASENMSPKMRQAYERTRASVSDSLATVSEKIKKQQPDGFEADDDAPAAGGADDMPAADDAAGATNEEQ
ncbi:AMP-dependent synthetase/ligase [Bifidobacterium eulemuris]|uniref:Acyl-CoA synthetase n=1 Tax=Bifidobacterium eulemuris TaxID=1765219 RepID=A0A261GCE3_9BIFI|nr:AMP-dependent synthetase/ligase [Bifidobacterium eulemuris]OZG69098.1 AMP-binding protein [Bifidobacterium eulemuris]QOL31383.1 long-chain fatty acid--CoA ligase [Bifidobacterium eulemuris]